MRSPRVDRHLLAERACLQIRSLALRGWGLASIAERSRVNRDTVAGHRRGDGPITVETALKIDETYRTLHLVERETSPASSAVRRSAERSGWSSAPEELAKLEKEHREGLKPYYRVQKALTEWREK